MARELAACVSADGRAVSPPPTVSFSQLASSPPNPISVRREVKTPEPAHAHAKRNLLQIDRRWILAVALIALCGLGWGLSYYAVMGKRTSGGAEKQHTVAEQSTVKEEPIATVPETRDAETPSPSVAVAPRASQEVSVVVAEPSLAPQTVVQTTQGPGAPNGAPATQANDPQTESSPATSGTPAGTGTAASNGPTEQNGNTLVNSEGDGSTVVWRRQENATPAHSKSGHSLDSKTKHTKHAPQPPAHPGGFWQNLRKYFQ
jgi:hypothetical protein